MSLLASQIMDRSAAILNDVAKDLYTYAVQLPYLQIANEELSDEFAVNGITLDKKTVASKTILANATTYGTLPTDFLMPQQLFERPTNQPNQDFIPMTQVMWDPTSQPGITLGYWYFQDNAIKFLGATQDTDVRLDYIRTLTDITGSSSVADVSYAFNFLAYMTAAHCAYYIGRNKSISDELKLEAYKHLNRVLMIGVRQNQSLPLRRRRFQIAGLRRYR